MTPQERAPFFSTRLVFGLTVLAVGLILMADTLHWYDAWHLLAWWPLVLAAFGLARLAQDGLLSLGGHIWLGFAAAAFIQQFGPWGLLERWWPAFIIWGGVIVTLRAIFPQPKYSRRSRKGRPSPNTTVSGDPEVDSTQVKP
ncbi:MAG TPA: DUF5668 domain-containing protein [Geothrix sp.]|nr:DUF5668 domain-containing protein [Geothrix sp.]